MKKQPAGLLEKLLKNRQQEGVSLERHMEIDVHDLEPNPNNFYSMNNIQRLKNLIESTGKVDELTVKAIGKGKYMVIAGHRRRRAVLELLEEGVDISPRVPCSVVSFTSEGSKTAEDMELLWLSASNLGQREYRTMMEKIWEISVVGKILRKDYEEDYRGGFYRGAFRSYLASFLCMTESRLQRLYAMRKVLPEYLRMVDDGRLKETAAYELSNLNDDEQRQLMKALDNQEITVQLMKTKKAELFTAPATETDTSSEIDVVQNNVSDPAESIEEDKVEHIDAESYTAEAEDEKGSPSANEQVADVVEETADGGRNTTQVKSGNQAENIQLMASIDRLMSYCEGRHDASQTPCQGCMLQDGASGCRMGTKPCEWRFESRTRKLSMAI